MVRNIFLAVYSYAVCEKWGNIIYFHVFNVTTFDIPCFLPVSWMFDNIYTNQRGHTIFLLVHKSANYWVHSAIAYPQISEVCQSTNRKLENLNWLIRKFPWCPNLQIVHPQISKCFWSKSALVCSNFFFTFVSMVYFRLWTSQKCPESQKSSLRMKAF